MPRFLADNPRVALRLPALNDDADMISDGINLAIRGHARRLPDSRMIQRRITETSWHLFALPDIARQIGEDASPTDLESQPGLALGWRPGGNFWSLQGPGGNTASISYAARLRSDDKVTLKQAAAEGPGAGALPAYVCGANRMEAPMTSAMRPERPSAIFSNMVALMS